MSEVGYHLKDMRDIFYNNERVRVHSVKAGYSSIGKVIFIGPFICTVEVDGFCESYNYADFLCSRIKAVK